MKIPGKGNFHFIKVDKDFSRFRRDLKNGEKVKRAKGHGSIVNLKLKHQI